MSFTCKSDVVYHLREKDRISDYKFNMAAASKCSLSVLFHYVGKDSLR